MTDTRRPAPATPTTPDLSRTPATSGGPAQPGDHAVASTAQFEKYTAAALASALETVPVV